MRAKASPRTKKQSGKSAPKKASEEFAADLTEIERDLLRQVEQGWQLETDSLGSGPQLRKGSEVRRAASVNRNTIRALETRGFLVPEKSGDPLKTVWRLKRR